MSTLSTDLDIIFFNHAAMGLPWSQRFFFIFLCLKWESREAAIDITSCEAARSTSRLGNIYIDHPFAALSSQE